ncbi:hypothetical protein [Flavobacterium hercynium]|uniref:Uncharacterized protein n=1 Tax=Flavobacterium hercynium TaxID=387094 RepID=A0A226GY24_9FLAO|nr:hypothetical protein [Flavobacterium hercynium]OXA86892.1 hypothetical protein B0A66_17130 [Flavobacterium hercynium]SMP13170.1 hypothetical protein SAMN06265346_103306 [Flavobacterium hercynium]
MGTSISFGDYEPTRISEPWKKHQRVALKWAYYTQSAAMQINNLQHCVTILTSLKIYSGYNDEKFDGYPYQQDKNIYASALNIYISNTGDIIGGDCVVTYYKTIGSKSGFEELDKNYEVRRKKKSAIDGSTLHNLIINEGRVKFRDGSEFKLGTFQNYIKEATIVNRKLDQNYTRIMISKDKSEIEKILTRLSIFGGIIGFIPVSEAAGAFVLTKEVIGIFCFFLGLESEFKTLDLAYPMYDIYQIGRKSYHQDYGLYQGQDGEFYQQKIGKQEQREENILKGIVPIVEKK